MRLKGTLRETELEQSLRDSGKFLRADPLGKALVSFLPPTVGKVDTAYLLESTPYQGEDCYLLLINSKRLFYIEIERSDQSVNSVEEISLHEYRQSKGMILRLKLTIAVKLAAQSRQLDVDED